MYYHVGHIKTDTHTQIIFSSSKWIQLQFLYKICSTNNNNIMWLQCDYNVCVCALSIFLL